MARSFNGTTDSVNFGNPALLNNVSPVTYFAWICPFAGGEGGLGRVFQKDTSFVQIQSTSTLGFKIRYTHNFSVSAVTRLVATGQGLLPGVWTPFAITFSGGTAAADLDMFLNGVTASYETTQNGSGVISSDASGAFIIGNRPANDRTWDGLIAHFQLFNRRLSQYEINQIAYNPGSITNNLIAYWPLFGQASPEIDLSPYHSFGTLSGTTFAYDPPISRTFTRRRRTSIRTVTPVSGVTETGSVSGSRNFNGTTDNISFLATAHTAMSACAWVYVDASGNSDFPRIFDSPAYQFYFGKDITAPLAGDNNTLKFSSVQAVTNGVWNSPENSLLNGRWYHVGVLWDSAEAAPLLLIDGIMQTVTEQTAPNGGQVSNAGTGYIGNNAASTRALDGKVAHLQIFSRKITEGEVRQCMRMPGSVREGLLSYWPLHGDASPEPDLSGNRNNGTVTGTVRHNGPPIGRGARLARRVHSTRSVTPPAAGPVFMSFLATPDTEFLNLQSGGARPFYYIESIISGVTALIGVSYTSTNWLIDGGLIDREKPALPGDRSSIFSSDVTIKCDNSTFRFSPKVTSSIFYNNDYLESPFNYWAGFQKQDIGGTALTALLVQRGAFILENLQLDSRNGVAYMRLRDKFKRALQKEIGTRDISGTAIQYTVTGNVDANTVLQSLFITGANLTAGDLSLQTSTFTYNNLSLSQQSIADAASLIAEASDGFLYTSRRGILTYLSNMPTFATASASFVVRESSYAENTFFEETKDDRLTKVILDYLSGTSTFVAAEITGTTGQVLSITNDSVQGSTEAYALVARTLGRYSGQVSKIRLESVWLPSLDINDRVEVHATALGLSGHIFDIYKIEEQPTLGIMTIYGITERGVKNRDTNKFFFWSDPSAAESGGNFTGATGESNGWQNNYFYWCRETTTAVQPAFDANGNNDNSITTGFAASGAGSTGIEVPFMWY